MKNIFIKLFIITVSVSLVLWGVDSYYREKYSVEYKLPKKILANEETVQKYQIVKVGNSHSMDGITFDGYKLRALSLANSAQKFDIDLAMLKQHAAEIEENAVILIVVTPISFSHTDVNALKGLQAEYYGRISPFFIPQLNVGDFLESEFLPFVRSGYFLRQKNAETIKEMTAKVQAELSITNANNAESKSAEINLPNKTNVSLTQVSEDFLNVETIEKELSNTPNIEESFDNIHFTYTKWMETDEFSTQFFDENRHDLEKLIEYSLQKKWKPVLISIPISDQLEKALPKNYKQEYLYVNLDKTNKQGVEYIDFSNDLKNNTNLFSNADHLNKKGSAVLSYLLLKKLIQVDYLPDEADGYNH